MTIRRRVAGVCYDSVSKRPQVVQETSSPHRHQPDQRLRERGVRRRCRNNHREGGVEIMAVKAIMVIGSGLMGGGIAQVPPRPHSGEIGPGRGSGKKDREGMVRLHLRG